MLQKVGLPAQSYLDAQRIARLLGQDSGSPEEDHLNPFQFYLEVGRANVELDLAINRLAYPQPSCDHPRQKFTGDGWKCVDCGKKF